MTEKFVANQGESLYRDIRGGIFLAGLEGEKSDKKSKSKEKSEIVVEQKPEKRAELEKKRQRLEESARRSAQEAVKKVARVVEKKEEGRTGEDRKPDTGVPEELRRIVETDKPLMYASGKDVNQVLASKGLDMRVNEDQWEKLEPIVRAHVLREMGVHNFAKIGPRVTLGPDTKLYIEGLDKLDKKTLEDALRDAGKTIKLPKGWDEIKDPDEQMQMLKSAGVVVVGELRGAQDQPQNPEDNREEKTSTIEVLINRLMGMKTTDSGWQTMTDSLRGLIEKIKTDQLKTEKGTPSYSTVNDAVKSVKDLEIRAASAKSLDQLDAIISKADRDALEAARVRLDTHYQDIYNRMDPAARDRLFEQLNIEAANYLRAARSGLYSTTDRLDYAILRMIKEAEDRELPQEAGVFEWRATKLLEQTKTSQLETLLRQPPVNWEDSMEHLNNIFRFVESTDFSLEQLQQALQEAVNISREIPIGILRGRELEEAKKMQEEINDLIESVQAVHGFFTTMERADMKPDEVVRSFSIFKDDTLKIYFGRFDKDDKGEVFKDAEGHEFNLLDKAMGTYMARLNHERKLMNKIEQWTREGFSRVPTDAEELKAFNFIKGEVGGVGKLRGNDNATDKAAVRKVEGAVNKWYRLNTLLGAEEFGKVEGVDEPVNLVDYRKGEIKEKLKEDLQNKYGLSAERVEHLESVGLLDSVVNNGYKMSWSFAWSDYDGIRIYGQSAPDDAHPDRQRVLAYAFNQSTHMFWGRHLDHLNEFYVNELRGKLGKTNEILQDNMLGKRGDILPQNRTMVRFASKLIPGLFGSDELGRKIRSLRNIDRLDIDGDTNDFEWARSAAVAELIDDGEMDFSKADWSKAFGEQQTNISKYGMIDLFGDRNAALNYEGRENLQQYLQNPNSKKFFEINNTDKLFYSGREVRIKPWMKLVIPAHTEMGDRWKQWWKLPYKMAHAEKEEVIETAVQTNRLEVKYRDPMKRRYLAWGSIPGTGTLVFRRLRQLGETSYYVANENKKVGLLLPLLFIFEFFKQGFGQMQAQMVGK